MASVAEGNMKYILVFAGSRSQYDFYNRLSRPLALLGYELIYLTVKPSLFIKAKRDGFKCHLVPNSRSSAIPPELSETTEVASQQVSSETAAKFFNGTLETAENCFSNGSISNVFIWNGHSIPSRALTKFAQAHALHTLYFELSNIPGKIFVDKAGVNARSSLFNNPEQLDSYQINSGEYERWQKAYVALSRERVLSQTAREKGSVNNFLFPLDSVGAWFGLPTVGEMNLIAKTRSKLLDQKKGMSYDTIDLAKTPYVFFPMQVSDDSQLLFNTGVGLGDALEIASRRSRELGVDLIIKPHPVEENEKAILQLNEIRKQGRTFIVNDSTIRLIESCREVITINSTVGLEAMILGKPVTFLGRTFYGTFNDERMKKYILRYLINIDYFGTGEISVDTMKEVISRL